jgi:hypothetical protein
MRGLFLITDLSGKIKNPPCRWAVQWHPAVIIIQQEISESVYINVALNVLWSSMYVYIIDTTTDPRPSFSSLQNSWQTFAYTVLLVDICTCSWKTIEFMLASASEPATSFAWYSRTLRMRRGPNTNICTTVKIGRTPSNIVYPIEFEFYRNDEPLV